MNITRDLQEDGRAVLSLSGRLDAFWSENFDLEMEEMLRAGRYHIVLDASQVEYLSSAGLRSLMKAAKSIEALSGSFSISRASEPVRQVLQMTGLDSLFSAPAGHSAEQEHLTPSRSLGARMQVFFEEQGNCFDGLLLEGTEASKLLTLSEKLLAIGIGAFGGKEEEGAARFGELIAVGGVACSLPTDSGHRPDFLLSADACRDAIRMKNGLICEGSWSKGFRFEASPENPVSLSVLASECLSLSGAATACVGAICESAGLIGAFLKRSPSLAKPGEDIFGFPGIRDWLSFTPERAYAGCVVLLSGVVSRDPELRRFLRPISQGRDICGHFHAAVFTYQPLRHTGLSLPELAARLCSEEKLLSVLHLLHDERHISGSGESFFSRGASWISPLSGWRHGKSEGGMP
ncbi:MAG: hypothetical protein A2X49_11195 [Lentisphaerae bacterium GWF2_52_8]|nr:MAG: hypothetical protein A2X49_11195 [Lentisphaerae bacterium GWF2_52_8]